jgi:HEPN domain-containing protein
MDWVRKWLKRANDDLTTARHVMENLHPKLLEVCCYESQQAAEKALKAYLIFKEYKFPLTHDLFKLCNFCAAFDARFHDFADDCSDLTPYAVHARYPMNEEMDELEAQSALHKAERIVQFCASKIALQN